MKYDRYAIIVTGILKHGVSFRSTAQLPFGSVQHTVQQRITFYANFESLSIIIESFPMKSPEAASDWLR